MEGWKIKKLCIYSKYWETNINKQNKMWTLKLIKYIFKCTILPIYGSFFTCSSHVFLILNYWNFDIRMFVLRLSISVQVSNKIFGIINGGVKISIVGLE